MYFDGVLRAAVFGNTVISMRHFGRGGSPRVSLRRAENPLPWFSMVGL
jgi:hypothetical protein